MDYYFCPWTNMDGHGSVVKMLTWDFLRWPHFWPARRGEGPSRGGACERRTGVHVVGTGTTGRTLWCRRPPPSRPAPAGGCHPLGVRRLPGQSPSPSWPGTGPPRHLTRSGVGVAPWWRHSSFPPPPREAEKREKKVRWSHYALQIGEFKCLENSSSNNYLKSRERFLNNI